MHVINCLKMLRMTTANQAYDAKSLKIPIKYLSKLGCKSPRNAMVQ